MKIRNGFVSNSSTSSFVMIGFVLKESKHSRLDILKVLFPNDREVMKLTGEDDDFEDLWYDKIGAGDGEFSYRGSGDDGMPDGKFCIGVDIANPSDDGGIEEDVFDVKELLDKIENLREVMNIPKTEKTKIVSGVYAS